MKMLSENASTYLKAVSLALPCSGREKKRVTALLSQSVQNAILENPNMTKEELRVRFGSPEEVAEAAMDASPQTASNRRLRRKVCIFALLCFILCTVAFVACQVHLYVSDEKFYSGYCIETIYEKGEDETEEEFQQRMLEKDIQNGAKEIYTDDGVITIDNGVPTFHSY